MKLKRDTLPKAHRLNVELDLQSLFGLMCTTESAQLQPSPRIVSLWLYVCYCIGIVSLWLYVTVLA
jgi:hypothetical protein